MRRTIDLLLLSALLLIARPAWTAERTVVIGPDYAAGWLHELWLGKGYRDLWTAPVTLPVLDLGTFAGGLTPVRQVGGLQTAGLALQGADGRSYTFRSLEKEPERSLPVEWREAWPGRIVRDHTSTTHPGAALLLPPLAEAVGILHTEPHLVVMPDDSALGTFRGTFANRVGTLEEYPQAAPGVPPFHEATEIIDTKSLWARWLAGPDHRVDSRAYLRARTLDLYVENYDRHRGQWRWARLPGRHSWEPLPEDPDMAFIRNDGLAIATLRYRTPKFVRFRDRFESRLGGSTRNGSEVDRWLLTDLDRTAFEGVVRETQSRLSDEAIATAVGRLPPEWKALSQERLVSALRARRLRLVEHLMHYYRDLARQVDVHATDRDEVVTLDRLDEGAVEVRMALAGASEPYYRRRFLPGETGEVRVYLHGGDDRVERRGPAGGPIRVHVIAGEGRDVVDDSASGGTEVWVGSGDLEIRPGRHTHRHAGWVNPEPDPGAPWLEPRNWGRWTLTLPQLSYASELEFVVGAAVTRTEWGFRSFPEARRDELSAAWSSGEGSGRISYTGTFRQPGSRTALQLHALASGIERINFFGFGNESSKPASRTQYRTLQELVALEPSVRFDISGGLELRVGADARASDTPTDQSNILNGSDAYGRGPFLEAGARAGLRLDTRSQTSRRVFFEPGPPRNTPESRAINLRFDGFYFPAVLDVDRGFGGIEGEVDAYLGRLTSRVQLAARLGGRRVWGTYPWFESAFIGGSTSVRGFSRNRFAGDGSIYGGLEARTWLVSLDMPPVPLRLGALGLADVGRVWLEGEDSDRWHSSWGVGAMLQPIATPFVLAAAMAQSPEETRYYFGSGFFF